MVQYLVEGLDKVLSTKEKEDTEEILRNFTLSGLKVRFSGSMSG